MWVSCSHTPTLKKLQDEIVSQLPYIDMVISEVLRMYSIANIATQRRATDNTIVQGINIEKSTIVQADVYSIHYDIDLVGPNDPYSFVPERHRTTTTTLEEILNTFL
ncbi:hypothetical protein I4U23_005502 [Adineta vaga]|nr:hypothetical protein I4U23_005502 [Adineta vaga]